MVPPPIQRPGFPYGAATSTADQRGELLVPCGDKLVPVRTKKTLLTCFPSFRKWRLDAERTCTGTRTLRGFASRCGIAAAPRPSERTKRAQGKHDVYRTQSSGAVRGGWGLCCYFYTWNLATARIGVHAHCTPAHIIYTSYTYCGSCQMHPVYFRFP